MNKVPPLLHMKKRAHARLKEIQEAKYLIFSLMIVEFIIAWFDYNAYFWENDEL
jgi:hypothetical protein